MSIFDAGAESDPFSDLQASLVDAGYFRARISTLPKFDLLVGGLAWAITLINMEVDLSLDDQANLGQKIKLAEMICKVLERMKCPMKLLAHQIQGLDFPAVLPVMNWLLQKVVEVRAENEAATCVLFCPYFWHTAAPSPGGESPFTWTTLARPCVARGSPPPSPNIMTFAS